MSKTHYVGNYPDHVTRYSHKSTDRWLNPVRPVHSINWAEVESIIIIALSVAVLIAVGVMILQPA